MSNNTFIIAEMACDRNDNDLQYIDASHLFPDSQIKVGFRHSRHISAFQYDFLHMLAPYLDIDAIKVIAGTRDRQERQAMLPENKVPSYQSMQSALLAASSS